MIGIAAKALQARVGSWERPRRRPASDWGGGERVGGGEAAREEAREAAREEERVVAMV